MPMRSYVKNINFSSNFLSTSDLERQSLKLFLADRDTQHDRLLASSCRLSIRLSVCDAVHSDSQGWCSLQGLGLKVAPACS